MSEKTTLRGGNPLAAVRKEYIKWTAYGLLLLAAFLLQSAPRALQIAGAKPLLLVPLVVAIALFTGPIGGGAAGAAAGFLWDVYADCLPGFHGLFLLVIGCGCGLLVVLLMRNNQLTAVLLCAGALVLQVLYDWGLSYLLLGYDRPFAALWYTYLPCALYTLLVSPLVYGITLAVTRVLRRRD